MQSQAPVIMEQAYAEYFQHQAGSGHLERNVGPVYEASYASQSGRGCCGIGRVLTAAATPLIVKGVKAVSEELSNAGFSLYRDIQRDPSLPAVSNAAINRLTEAGQNLKRRARRALTGRGTKQTRKRTTKRKPAKRRSTASSKKKINRRSTASKRQTGRGAQRERKLSKTPPDIFS